MGYSRFTRWTAALALGLDQAPCAALRAARSVRGTAA
jgi:hypothetical protein